MAQGPWAFKLIFAGSYLALMILIMMMMMIKTLSKVVASILFLIGLVAGGGASAW